MAVPTIIRVSPSTGPTGGRRVVKVWGSNFRLPTPPPLTFPAPPSPPSVEVLFGTEKALDVQVMAESLLHVTLASHDPGTFPVTVRNIDDDGNPIPGESVTQADGFTFARPELNNPREKDRSNLTRVVAAIVLELRKQILENVVLATHTDYDDAPDGANVAALSTVPGLVLSGPNLRLNRFFAENKKREAEDATGLTFQQRPARTVDLVFTLIGVDNVTMRELDLMSEATAFFARNTTLRLLRDPEIPGNFVEYELDLEPDGDFKQVGTANNSNIRAFSGSFCIRGFDIDDPNMAEVAAPVVQDLDIGVLQLEIPDPDL